MEIFTSLAATHLEDPERLKGYLSKIMVSSNHLLSLINDVLDMSRIESGKVKIEENECSIPVGMTANAFEEDVQEALKAGMNDHMAKPIRIETLYALMRKNL